MIIPIEAAVPYVTSVQVSVSVARVDRWFTCEYTATDSDEGDILTPFYTWFSGGFTIESGTTDDRVYISSADGFRKGDDISCSVYVTDSDGQTSTTVVSDQVIIVNTPPEATMPVISPNPAMTVDNLTCNAGDITDIDDSGSFTVTYNWLLNTTYLNISDSILNSDNFNKGDQIQCETTPSDGTDDGDAIQSATIIISDSYPVIGSVTLSPNITKTLDNITCIVSDTIDYDGATDFVYNYTWLINDDYLYITDSETNITSLYDSSILISNYTKLNDEIICSVAATVEDENLYGYFVQSNTTTIVNTAPSIITNEIMPSTPSAYDDIYCNVTEIYDPDNINNVYNITYYYYFRWYVNDELVSSLNNSTNTTFELNSTYYVKDDIIICSVAVADIELGTYKNSTDKTIVNSKPLLSNTKLVLDDYTTPTSAICTPVTVSDPDNDIITGYIYQWYVNNTKLNDQTTNTLSSTNWSTGLEVYCILQATDGEDNSLEDQSNIYIMSSPIITNFTIYDPDNMDSIYDIGDVLTITFNEDTDLGNSSQTTYNYDINITLTKEAIDYLFTFSNLIGQDYIGTWINYKQMNITILDGRTSDVILGNLTVAIKAETIKNYNQTSLYINTNVSNGITGTFGNAGSIFKWGLLGKLNSYTNADIDHTPTAFEVTGDTIIKLSHGIGNHIFGISSTKVYGVGLNDVDQIGLDGDTITALDASSTTYQYYSMVTDWTEIDSLDGIGINSIANGLDHSVAVTNDGKIYTTGSNQYGQCGFSVDTIRVSEFTNIDSGSSLPVFEAAAAGDQFTILLCQNCDTDGTASRLYAFGNNFADIYSTDVATYSATVVTSADGMDITSISAGDEHVLLLTNSGNIYGWGRNYEGQLGLGEDVDTSASFTQIVMSDSIIFSSISAGSSHSLAISTTGGLYCWGKNSDQQCGSSTNNRIYTPILIASSSIGYTIPYLIRAGATHSFVVNGQGQIYTFGTNNDNVLGLGSSNVNKLFEPTLINNIGSDDGPWIYLLATSEQFSIAITYYESSSCLSGCSNHGSCVSGSCQCIGDWEGDICDQPICPKRNDIECSGYGTCIAGDIPYCDCVDGFQGESCGIADCNITSLNDCNNDNEVNITNTCTLINATYNIYDTLNTSLIIATYNEAPYCQCTQGWAQPDCSSCITGYSGDDCSVIDCTALSNCSNAGSCFYNSTLDEVQCNCNTGYSGTICQTSIPICETGLSNLECSGKGSCLKDDNDVSYCDCDDRWYGDSCANYLCPGEDSNGNDDPCLGRGTCQLINNTLNELVGSCSCNNNWSGSDCSQPVCTNDCNNNGQCIINTNDVPECDCNEGFSGTDCSKVTTTQEEYVESWTPIFIAVILVILLCFVINIIMNRIRKAQAHHKRFFDPTSSTDFVTLHVENRD